MEVSPPPHYPAVCQLTGPPPLENSPKLQQLSPTLVLPCPSPHLHLDPKMKSQPWCFSLRGEHFRDAPWASAKLLLCCWRQKTMRMVQLLPGQRSRAHKHTSPSPTVGAPELLGWRPEGQRGGKMCAWHSCLLLGVDHTHPCVSRPRKPETGRRQVRDGKLDLSKRGMSFYKASGSPLSICSHPTGAERSSSQFLISCDWFSVGWKCEKLGTYPGQLWGFLKH